MYQLSFSNVAYKQRVAVCSRDLPLSISKLGHRRGDTTKLGTTYLCYHTIWWWYETGFENLSAVRAQTSKLQTMPISTTATRHKLPLQYNNVVRSSQPHMPERVVRHCFISIFTWKKKKKIPGPRAELSFVDVVAVMVIIGIAIYCYCAFLVAVCICEFKRLVKTKKKKKKIWFKTIPFQRKKPFNMFINDDNDVVSVDSESIW